MASWPGREFWAVFFNTSSSPPNTVTVTNPGNQSGTTGMPVSLAITATDSDPLQTLAFSAAGLPAGLSIDAGTGVISGSPGSAGASSVIVTATDLTGAHGSTSFTWTVTAPGGTTLVTSITTAPGTDAFGNAYLAGVTSYATDGVTNIDGAVVLVYAPSPGSGNLIASLSPAPGADSFGNSYPAGLYAQAGTFSGTLLAGLISGASIGSSDIAGSDFASGTIETTVITMDGSGGSVLAYGSVTGSQTFTSSGTWTAPPGVTSAHPKCWGAGAAGNTSSSRGGGAGGGGEYAENPAIGVTPATGYAVTVGAAGVSNGGAGTLSSFVGDSVAVRAHGGKGGTAAGAGGAGGTGSTAPVHFDGGAGGSVSGAGLAGAGGGSSAGPSGNGNPGGSVAGITSPPGAGGLAPAGGGAGGAGANAGSDGSAGSAPGGGGGGAGENGQGGSGAGGKVIVTWQTSATNLIGAAAGVAGADAAGNAFGAGFTGQLAAFHPGQAAGSALPETAQAMVFANSWAAVAGRPACQYLLAGAPATAAAQALSVSGSFKVPAGFAAGQAVTTAAPAGYRPVSTVSLIGMDVTSGAIVRFTWGTGGVLQYNQLLSGTVAVGDTIDLQPATVYLGN